MTKIRISFLLSLSENVIPPPLEDTVLRSISFGIFLFFVLILLFKGVIGSTKNQIRPKNRRKL